MKLSTYLSFLPLLLSGKVTLNGFRKKPVFQPASPGSNKMQESSPSFEFNIFTEQ